MPRRDPVDDFGEMIRRVRRRVMILEGVGAFDDQCVNRAARPGRVADDRLAPAADVAGEDHAVRLRPGDLHLDVGTSENVSGVAVGDGEIACHGERPLVRMRFHQLDRLDGVGHGVEWRRRRAGAALLLQPFEVALLNVRGIGEHRGAQIARRRGREDRLVVLIGGEERQATGMIDVRVAQDHGIKLARIERELGVECGRFVALALEHAAIEEDAMAIPFEQVAGAGHLSRRAPERDRCAHETSPLTKVRGSLAASARR